MLRHLIVRALIILMLGLPTAQAFGQWFDRPASKQERQVEIFLADLYEGEVRLPVANTSHGTTFTFSTNKGDLLRGRVTSSWPTQAVTPFVGLGDADRVSLVSSGQGYQVVWTLQRVEDGVLKGMAESLSTDGSHVQRAEVELRPKTRPGMDPMARFAGDAVPVMPGDANVKRIAMERRLAWERAAPPNFKPVDNPPLVGRWNTVLRWPDEKPQLTSLDVMTFNGESFTFGMFGRQDANLGQYEKSTGVIHFKWGRQTYRARVFQNEQGQWMLDGDYTYGIITNLTAGTKGGTFRAVKLRSGESPNNEEFIDVPTGS